MSEWFLASGTAFWLGILTSISPCPLATNITAISYIGRRVDRPKYVLLTGLLYTAGRTLTYVVLGTLLVAGLLAIPMLSHWLQKYMNRLLGPILILAGMFLLELLRFGFKGGGLGQWAQKRAEAGGLWAALLLGIVFALSFCPVSAALFFGSLIPLSVKQQSSFFLPLLYGVGTALPVLAFGLLIGLGANHVGRVFKQVNRFELLARRITGGVFVAVGFYFTLAYTIGIL